MGRTITAGQWAAPLKIGFTFQRLVVTERVACLTAKCHQRTHVEVVAVPLTVDRYAWIDTVIRLQLQSCREGKQA